jgi:hypothetical protein
MTKNTKSSQGPTRARGLVVDLKRIVKNIEGLHSCAWSQQQKARHGATNQTVVEKANAARAAAAVHAAAAVRVEAPIEMADADTLKQDAEAAAAAHAAAAVRVEAPIEIADADTLKQDAEAAAAARAAAAVRVAAAEKMRKQVAAKAAQAKGGGDAAGPSSPAA